jgi:MFS family permease
MIIGGLVYHTFGPKNIMMVAFVCHTIGILLTIFAGGYTTLLISTLLIGIGNGCTEAACNPMIADMYSGVKMQKMLARFHMWFPGGILVGSLISFFRVGSTDVGHDGSYRYLRCFILWENFSKTTIGRGEFSC